MLDLDAVQRNPAVLKILERVHQLSSLPVNFNRMDNWKPTHPSHPKRLVSPALHPTDSSYDVYLNETLPVHMAVHELIHVVLIEEGYPDIRFHPDRVNKPSKNLKNFEGYYDFLMNKLQHPEIYRRMGEEYELDMSVYQATVTAGITGPKTFDMLQGPLAHPFGKETAVADIIDLLYLQPGSEATLDRYRAMSPDTFATSEAIKATMDTVGFNNPASALKSFEAFTAIQAAFSESLGQQNDAELWKALEWFLPSK